MYTHTTVALKPIFINFLSLGGGIIFYVHFNSLSLLKLKSALLRSKNIGFSYNYNASCILDAMIMLSKISPDKTVPF